MVPRLFARLRGRKWPLWSQVLLLVVGVAGAAAITLPGGPVNRSSPDESPQAASPAPTTSTRVTIAERAPSTTVPSPSNAIAVQSVTDGDTIVLTDGRRVRLAQVDAPEIGACFGAQSTEVLRALIGDHPVTLRRPSNGPETDRYGRTLAEIRIDGVSVDEQLVRSGAAEWYEEFAHEDANIARRLMVAEAEARAAGRGLWSACRGGAPRAVTTTSMRLPGCHPGYPEVCIPAGPPDLDCIDINGPIRVDRYFGDPHRFDADRDGVGCEARK